MNDERSTRVLECITRLKNELAVLKSIWDAENFELARLPDEEVYDDSREELETFLDDLDEVRETLESVIISLEVMMSPYSTRPV